MKVLIYNLSMLKAEQECCILGYIVNSRLECETLAQRNPSGMRMRKEER